MTNRKEIRFTNVYNSARENT
uniref:Uncharacterized protein n=1 Tax=Anguilla anguilla TaxID=7936 RepID=A0A0E9V749_ANGAN